MAAREDVQYCQSCLGAIFWWIALGLARILPYGAFDLLGRGILFLFYALAGRKLRKVAYESLGIAFGERIVDQDKKRIADASAANLMKGLVGIMYSAVHPGFADQIFSIDGQDHLDAALQKGKGAIIAIAHFGPFAWMIFKFIDRGYRVNVVMRPPRNKYIYNKVLESKHICGLNTIYSVPVRNCVVGCMQAFSKGELVFMPVDQNYGGAGRVFVDFFGRKAATAPGPALFTLKTGAPLFFAHALPKENGRFKITISASIDVREAASERETMIAQTAVVTKMVEVIARQYPEQWSWMHKRWKAVPRDGEI